jgi:hypothetical protein
MSGDPLRDLDCAARIHIFGDARRTEAVTTDSFGGSGSTWNLWRAWIRNLHYNNSKGSLDSGLPLELDSDVVSAPDRILIVDTVLGAVAAPGPLRTGDIAKTLPTLDGPVEAFLFGSLTASRETTAVRCSYQTHSSRNPV